jgi:antitoxin component of MazEF toxin-antitoxin module
MGAFDRYRYAKVPAIHLSGKWLAQLGFTPGARINVQVEGNTLILIPSKSREVEAAQ